VVEIGALVDERAHKGGLADTRLAADQDIAGRETSFAKEVSDRATYELAPDERSQPFDDERLELPDADAVPQGRRRRQEELEEVSRHLGNIVHVGAAHRVQCLMCRVSPGGRHKLAPNGLATVLDNAFVMRLYYLVALSFELLLGTGDAASLPCDHLLGALFAA
jgi:hypothetical protein